MISDDYIMGFVEGEGCFSVAIQRVIDRKPRKGSTKAKRKKPGLCFRVAPSFRITAVTDEAAVLYAIRGKFGFGEVYVQPRGGTSRPVSQYYAQSFSDLDKISAYFKDKHFYTRKGESFKLWCECLEIIRKKEHLTKEGLLRICELRDKMNPRLCEKHSRTKEFVKQILQLSPEHIEAHAVLHNNPGFDLAVWHQKKKGHHKLSETTPLLPNPP